FFFFQAEDGIRYFHVTGVQTCALPIYHFHTRQGMEFFNNEQAKEMAGLDADYHRRDLFEAIAKGDHPSWTLSVQVMPYEEAAAYRFNPFDLTKTWSHKD